jgi:hypothetical protein
MPTINIGRDRIGRKIDFEFEITTRNGYPEFTMSGMYWNKPHTDIIEGGQCCEDLLKNVCTWVTSRQKAMHMISIWKKWHLNGMHAGCKHQRDLGWENKKLSDGSCASHKYPLEALTGHFKQGAWIRPSKWVTADQCDKDGILCKPCPVCGYEYGSKWIREDLPKEIIDDIMSW